MAKPPSSLFDSGPTRRSPAGPFARAALSNRFIGVAALTLGAIAFYVAQKESALGRTDVRIIYTFSFIFLIPGLLYIVLATFVARQRRWAVTSSLALAMLDMTLLGLLFVTCWGAPGAAIVCVLAGLFVVALAVMTTHLGRSLEALKKGRSG
jgi:peptidoglycan/LPS O-acetylase OafA/YrhL